MYIYRVSLEMDLIALDRLTACDELLTNCMLLTECITLTALLVVELAQMVEWVTPGRSLQVLLYTQHALTYDMVWHH
jgi:hypothetical protein